MTSPYKSITSEAEIRSFPHEEVQFTYEPKTQSLAQVTVTVEGITDPRYDQYCRNIEELNEGVESVDAGIYGGLFAVRPKSTDGKSLYGKVRCVYGNELSKLSDKPVEI